MSVEEATELEVIGQPLPFPVGCLDSLGLSGYIMQKEQYNMLILVMENNTSQKRWDMLEKSDVQVGLLSKGGEIMIMLIFKGLFQVKAYFAFEFDSRTLKSSEEIIVDDLSEEHIQFRRNTLLRVVDQDGNLKMIRNMILSTSFSRAMLEAIHNQVDTVITKHNINAWGKMTIKQVMKIAMIDKPQLNSKPVAYRQ